MDPGCVITLTFFNNEAIRQQPMGNTSVSYKLTETRYGAVFSTLNVTFAGDIVLNTSIHANSSTATVYNITWLRVDAVTDAYTRAVVRARARGKWVDVRVSRAAWGGAAGPVPQLYGGWNGSSYLDDVWEFTAAEQLTEFRWNQSLVE